MFYINEKHAKEIADHAIQDDPNECCGILAGKDGHIKKLFRMTNAETSPYRYSMDPSELYHTYREIDNQGWDIIGIYHSHTHSEAYPSATDIRLATWPEARYILISLLDKENVSIRAFHIEDETVTEEDLTIGEAPA